MLDDLVSTIDRIKLMVKSHSNLLAQNETRTRTVLIDPLLNVLGWDVTDPEIVKVEWGTSSVSKQQVDYALFNDGKPVIIVEAKKLNEQLKTHVSQIIGYAIGEGIEYAILTDGNRWEMYDVFQKVSLPEKRVLDVNLTANNSTLSALKMLYIWRANLEHGSPTSVETPITAKPLKTIDPPPQRWMNFENFSSMEKPSLPKSVRFGDDSVVPVISWVDLLMQCLRNVVSSGHLDHSRLPIKSSEKSYFIHTTPIHPTGKKFSHSKEIGNSGIFVWTLGNAKELRDRIRLVWKECNLSLRDLHVEL